MPAIRVPARLAAGCRKHHHGGSQAVRMNKATARFVIVGRICIRMRCRVGPGQASTAPPDTRADGFKHWLAPWLSPLHLYTLLRVDRPPPRVVPGKGGLIHMVLDFDTILLWMVVGLVAGFVASHLALGHGLGLVGDLIAGIVGALVGGFLAGLFHWGITIVGHPILSAMLIAFIGAVLVLRVLRLFRGSGVARGRALSS